MMKTKTLLLFAVAILCTGVMLAQGVDFAIRNQQLTSGGTKYELDIYMGADQTGTYHSRGQVYLIYDTVAFGKNVVANFNFTYTPLSLLNETLPFSPSTAKYVTINAVDNTFNILALTWQSSFTTLPPSSNFHTEVPDTLTPLYHVVFDLASAGGSRTVAFDFDKMFNPSQQFYFLSAGNELPYVRANLPVELLSFTAEKQGKNEVLLNWVTTLEVNNDYFVIEKKRAEGEFEAIGQVKGAGTTEAVTRYHFTDRSLMAAQNFYRLRQVDIDGSVTYSDVVEVTFDELENTFSVYPSPATQFTYVRANSELTGDYKVQLVDVNGRIMQQTQFKKDTPGNELKLDLSTLSEGVYFIRLQSRNSEIQTLRVMKVSQ